MAMNGQKIVVGGLAAGVVMNVLDFISNNVVLKSMNEQAMKRLNVNMESVMSGGTMALMIGLDLVAGILLVWLYAAIRPRFGSGPRTAAYAGIAGWLLAGWAWTFVFALGVFPWSMYVPSSLAALVTTLVGAEVGAALYTEAGAGVMSEAAQSA